MNHSRPKRHLWRGFPQRDIPGKREEKEFGEYRTRRLVLEAFDKLAESSRFKDEMPKRVSAFEVPKKAAGQAETTYETNFTWGKKYRDGSWPTRNFVHEEG